MNDPRTPDRAHAGDRLGKDLVLILAVLVSTSFVMLLNETTLAVALPAIMTEFDITAATAQWALTIVMLTMAILLPASGWVLDRFTTRAVFFAAVGFFLAGTVVAALSGTFAVMLIGRVLQAVGTALIMPLQLTVVMTVVPPRRRGTVMGVISVVMAVGPALGPTYAGLFLGFSTWHSIFWSMVPLVGIAGLVGAWKLRNVGHTRRTALDALSLVLAAFAFGGLVYALSSIGILLRGGEGAAVAWVAAVVGVLTLVVFVARQRRLTREGRALLDLRPLGVRTFVLVLVTLGLAQLALLGLANTLPLYLQAGLLTGALVAGLVNLPGGILETVFSPIGGALYDRVGPRPLVIPGLLVMAGALGAMAFLDHTSPVWVVTVMFAVFSIGLAFVLTPLMTEGLGSLSSELYGHGSAILNTVMQLAAAAGTAVMIAIYSAGLEAGGGTPEAASDGAGHAFLACAIVVVVALVFALFLRPGLPGSREAAEVRRALGD